MSAHNPDNVSRHQGIYTPKESGQTQAIQLEIEQAKMSGNNKRVIDLLEELVDSKEAEIARLKQRVAELHRILTGGQAKT